MKRIFAFLLAALQLALFCACGAGAPATAPETQTSAETSVTAQTAGTEDARKVPKPLETPLYAFDHTPTVDEMRRTAVQAMRDMLTVQWYTPKTIRYNKSGAVSYKNFVFYTERDYRGLPYTSAGKGLFQFLEYYNNETGEMTYTDSASFNETVGNTCASCPSWALFSVCTSMRGRCISNFLTIPNGFLPLGEVTYPAVSDFVEYPTTKIIETNGREKILQAYALLQPADLLVYAIDSSDTGHTMMAIEKAHVEYSGSTVDANKSYVLIQDQRAGDYDVTEDGEKFTQSGRTEYKATFAELIKNGYIAVSPAELQGKKAYEKTAIQIDGKLENLDDFLTLAVKTNRPAAVAKIVCTEASGKETVIARHLFDRVEIESGAAFSFTPALFATNLSKTRLLPSSGSFTVKLVVIAADGAGESVSLDVTR